MAKAFELVGSVFDRLTVLERIENDRWNATMWLCHCECGNTCEVRSTDLTKGKQKSCGCLRAERSKSNKNGLTHGMKNTRPYNIWDTMKQRCLNPKSNNYKNYGAKGISVCDKWMTFLGFWEDMEDGYCDELTLDRIDVRGDYCKENCRWTTYSEQGYNKGIIATNKSGRTGVFIDKNTGKWEAKIIYQGESMYLGRYDSFEDAVAVRAAAELKYFGYNKE